MKFVDQVKIHIQAGDGGKGCVAFRREKFIPRGGPNGGDGGHGGDIIFQGNAAKSTLLDFQFQKYFKGESGVSGGGRDRHGRNGEAHPAGNSNHAILPLHGDSPRDGESERTIALPF